MLENDLKMNRAQYDKKSDAEKKDMIDKFQDSLREKLANMKKMFNKDEPSESK